MSRKQIETWVSIPGFKGRYEISNLGNVKTLARKVKGNRPVTEAILKPAFDGDYLSVSLSKNNKTIRRRIHRLVAISYVPNPNNLPQVNHKDTDKLNNCASNLEWTDSSGNMKHAYENGLLTIPNNVGENNSKAKLSESDVIQIRILYKSISCKSIANKFGISKQSVWDITSRRTWGHV